MTTELREKLQKRADGIGEWLDEIGSRCRTEQKHTDEGTGTERVYWHYGYCVAILDVLEALKTELP